MPDRPTMLRVKLDRNPHKRGSTPPPPANDPRAFHRTLPGYAPTPLVDAPELAREWRVGRVFLKDEAERFGLPAFKALGASWAVEQALKTASPRALVCATDGNHGRAVAWMARTRGLGAKARVPAGPPPARGAGARAGGAGGGGGGGGPAARGPRPG